MHHKILITGAFGYIGGRIAQALMSVPNTHLVLASRYSHKQPEWLSQPVTCAVIKWDDEHSLRNACRGVSAIIHLAAMNEIDAMNDPAAALEINGVATIRLLAAAKKENVKRFIYMSTSHVYGAPLTGVLDEDTCLQPIHPYATSHRAAEDAVIASHVLGNISGVVLRLSNSFGAPAHADINRWTLLVNDLCKQAVMNGELRLRSSGMQRRDFITLTDVENAVRHILNLPQKQFDNGVFNLGGDWSPTIYEMTCLISSRCKSVLGFEPEIYREKVSSSDNDSKLIYKVEKLAKTGFKLEKSINNEIDNMLVFCRDIFGKADDVS